MFPVMNTLSIFSTLYSLIACVDIPKNEPITIIQNTKGNGLVELKATVNSTGLKVVTAGFENYINNTFLYVCIKVIPRECTDGPFKDCYCEETKDSHVYNIVHRLNSSTNVSYEIIRAVMSIFDDQNIYSKNITVTSASRLEHDESSLLKIIEILLIAVYTVLGLALFGFLFFLIIWALRKYKQISNDSKVQSDKNYSSKNGSEKLLKKEIDLLLIDNTKACKRPTGSTELGQKSFQSTTISDLVTNTIIKDSTQYLQRQINVVNGPSITENMMEKSQNDELKHDLKTSFTKVHDGFNALILVCRYGDRYTCKDVQAMNNLKNILGDDFIEKYGILLLTGDDNIVLPRDQSGFIADWCFKQGGHLRNVCTECDKRVLVLDNITDDDEVKQNQINQLIQYVDQLNSNGELRLRY